MSATSVHSVFDPATSTITHVVWDRLTKDAVIFDPVLDYDPATQMVSIHSAHRLMRFILNEGLKVHWVLDTHAHADHLTSARELRETGHARHYGASDKLHEVLTTFKRVFGWPQSVNFESIGLDRAFRDGEEFTAGALRIQAIATPGHTAACTTFRLGEWLFTGDTIFMPDSGTGRCDFPGGSASQLYDSIWNRLYSLPDHFEVFVGHDYQPGGRPLRMRCPLGEQKRANIHLTQGTSRAQFVAFREGRDKTLSAPRLLNPALDWNLGAHQLVKKPKSLFSLANLPHAE